MTAAVPGLRFAFCGLVLLAGQRVSGVELPSPSTLAQADRWTVVSGEWAADEKRKSLAGTGGLLIAASPAEATAELTIQLRYDSLRYMSQQPPSGIIFGYESPLEIEADLDAKKIVRLAGVSLTDYCA